jgi:hypothetical protein
MKKLLVLLVVLSVATIANAGLKISVDGVVDGPDPILLPSQTVSIDIFSDGQTNSADSFIMMMTGPATLDISNAVNVINPPGAPASIFFIEDPESPFYGGVFFDFSIVEVPPPNLPAGVIADNIILHCDDVGEVMLTIMGLEVAGELDTQIIQQIPEPMTLGLLGLGGLFLRRRK